MIRWESHLHPRKLKWAPSPQDDVFGQVNPSLALAMLNNIQKTEPISHSPPSILEYAPLHP